MTARKPTALKLLEGTWRADRANPAEPQPAIGAEPPPWLPAEGPAREAWDRLAPILTSVRVLTAADAEALALGCVALADYLAPDPSPLGWRRRDAAWKRYAAMLRDFGMTPASRTRVAAAPAPERDPIDAWLAGDPPGAPTAPVKAPKAPKAHRRSAAAPVDELEAWEAGITYTPAKETR